MIKPPPITVASADRHVVDQDTYHDYGHDLTSYLTDGELVESVTVEADPPTAVTQLDGAAVVAGGTQVVAWVQANADVLVIFHAVTDAGREETLFTQLVITPR